MQRNDNISELSHELTYHWYILNNGQVQALFKDISIPEYIALHRILQISEKNNGSGRAYLKDIAEELCLTISKTSKMIGNLRDKGMVSWSHDGDGSDGTYITITDSGIRFMENQENLLKDYYGKVIETFGRENMSKLIELTETLESVMVEKIKEIGDRTDGKR